MTPRTHTQAERSQHFTVRDDDASLRQKLAVLSGHATREEQRPVSRSEVLRRLVDEALRNLPRD